MVALPGQVLVRDERGRRLVRPHDDPLRIDQFIQNVVVEEELLLPADMLEWEAVGRIEIGVGAGVHGPLTRPGLLHRPVRVDEFGLASRFWSKMQIAFGHCVLPDKKLWRFIRENFPKVQLTRLRRNRNEFCRAGSQPTLSSAGSADCTNCASPNCRARCVRSVAGPPFARRPVSSLWHLPRAVPCELRQGENGNHRQSASVRSAMGRTSSVGALPHLVNGT